MSDQEKAQAFVKRWQGVDGTERANAALFVGELCQVLGIEVPGPAREDTGGQPAWIGA